MAEMALVVADADAERSLPASLSLPAAGRASAGLVPLHGAANPSRDFFLYRHLAEVLPEHGIAVLRYDRRPCAGDVPFDLQTADALAALRLLRGQPGLGDVPLGLWGFSQGAWAAAIAAAALPEVAFLVLVGSAGMSPAAQMRYGTARQLRAAGYGDDALRELAELRAAWEAFQRGDLARGAAQSAIDRRASRPWFSLSWAPPILAEPGAWQNMDFDPEPVFARVHCPVLLFYGEDDEWAPIDDSIAAWQRAAARAANTDLTVIRLPGTMHRPTLHGGDTIASISPAYTAKFVSWLKPRWSPATETALHLLWRGST
ncbi:MAG: alpha/beta fold hydrolase [Dehalococcoidia bacterium]